MSRLFPNWNSQAAVNVLARDLSKRGYPMSTILLIILVLLLVGALPTWGYSSGWGYFPSGALGLIFLVLLILILTGRVNF